jgi:hypothetical protein
MANYERPQDNKKTARLTGILDFSLNHAVSSFSAGGGTRTHTETAYKWLKYGIFNFF